MMGLQYHYWLNKGVNAVADMTSVEVAQRFGLKLNSLTSYLTDHPELRPKRRVGGSFLWTPEEVERFAQFRMRAISRGAGAKERNR
jgi:hypothetical protein